MCGGEKRFQVTQKLDGVIWGYALGSAHWKMGFRVSELTWYLLFFRTFPHHRNSDACDHHLHHCPVCVSAQVQEGESSAKWEGERAPQRCVRDPAPGSFCQLCSTRAALWPGALKAAEHLETQVTVLEHTDPGAQRKFVSDLFMRWASWFQHQH